MRPAAACAVVVVLALIGGCAGGGLRGGDGPPRAAADTDLERIPDAVPRREPGCLPCQRPYRVGGRWYRPVDAHAGYTERGTASWYGRKFHGRATASGEPYDMYAMTAAHPLLPLPSYVRVRHLGNGREVVVRINDRGPFLHGRVLDLSYAAAARLDLLGAGSGPVELRVLQTPILLAGAGAPVGAARPGPAGARYLQAGAFADAARAQALMQELRGAGFGPVEVRGGTRLHRVRLGPFTPDQATQVSTALAERGLVVIGVAD